ncbi:MAG: carbon storage regulator CsrA [Succinivibrionaceae bacterium]
MLILTRRIDESLTINGNVKITVLSIKGNQIRIGIEAPKDVSIQRTELLENDDFIGEKLKESNKK